MFEVFADKKNIEKFYNFSDYCSALSRFESLKNSGFDHVVLARNGKELKEFVVN